MKEILDQQRALGFPDLAGSALNIVLPLRHDVVNDLLRAALFKRGPKGPLTGLSIRFHSDNRFTLDATIDQFLLPKNISIDGTFAPTTNLQEDPRLLILLAPSGLLGMLIKIVLGAIESVKPFLTVSGEKIFVDLRVLLVKAGAAEYLPYLRTLKIRTDPGLLTLALRLHIDAEKPL